MKTTKPFLDGVNPVHAKAALIALYILGAFLAIQARQDMQGIIFLITSAAILLALMLDVKDAIEIDVAFIVAFIFYQALAIGAGTPMPIVSVVSESMEPILHKGDLVFIIAPSNVKVGDILIYQSR